MASQGLFIMLLEHKLQVRHGNEGLCGSRLQHCAWKFQEFRCTTSAANAKAA
jgi:hypothetical protein